MHEHDVHTRGRVSASRVSKPRASTYWSVSSVDSCSTPISECREAGSCIAEVSAGGGRRTWLASSSRCPGGLRCVLPRHMSTWRRTHALGTWDLTSAWRRPTWMSASADSEHSIHRSKQPMRYSISECALVSATCTRARCASSAGCTRSHPLVIWMLQQSDGWSPPPRACCGQIWVITPAPRSAVGLELSPCTGEPGNRACVAGRRSSRDEPARKLAAPTGARSVNRS